MAERTEIFNAVATPLTSGVTLVEASAGTGKTFAISMLVLRAVVELGIELKQILVVTYTVAATEELRERVRKRLVQARNQLRSIDGPEDQVLSQWLNNVKDRQQAEHRLELALLDIDSIGIHTIHGFCQLTLAEQILESGHFFDTDLISDTTIQRRDLLHDFWRENLYNIDRRYGSLIVAAYPEPQRLYQSIKGAEDPLARLIPELLTFTDSCQNLDSARQKLLAWWRQHGDELKQDLSEADQNGYLKTVMSREYEGWLEVIETSFTDGSSPDSQIVSKLLDNNLVDSINGRKIRGEAKKRELVASWTVPGDEAEIYVAAVEGLRLAFRVELARFLRRELTTRLHSQGLVSFDKLIVDLAGALDFAEGDNLVAQVGNRYKMALIDEFQDTDSAQYKIFSHFFAQGDHYLYLIGDPKQAIYRFRGADIHSYLEARDNVDRQLTLNCNFRSNPGLVEAVNRLLKQREIGGTTYQPVRSPDNIQPDRLLESGGEQPGLIYCQLDRNSEEKNGWTVSDGEEEVRSWVINQVLRLIHPGSALTIERTDEYQNIEQTPVKPGDIGILVRTNNQAQRFFNEFSRRGVPVVLSSRKSVFHTQESQDLLLVLQAVAMPSETPLLKSAIGRDWFGLGGNQFYLLSNDEDLFNQYRQRFHGYHLCWNESGLLIMINRLLEDEQIFLNLSKLIQAKRRITNIQHLVELIQKQENERRLTIFQTLTWFQEKLIDPASAPEAELRLESDEDAVNVVTMHSAKGLEYEIVFCPFLYRSSVTSWRSETVSCFDPGKGRICDLGSELFEDHELLSKQEEYDEDLRLAYVAITRARLRSYLLWVDIKPGSQTTSSFESPLGRLLFAGGSIPFGRQQEALQTLGLSDHCQYELMSPGQPAVHFDRRKVDESELRARDYSRGRLQTNRIRTSFSGLTTLSKHHGDETVKAGDEKTFKVAPQNDLLPGGVRFGNMIHDALEKFSFTELANRKVDPEELNKLARQYRFDIDRQPIADLLNSTVTTPLVDSESERDNFSLAMLSPEKMVKEMEFNLHLDPVSTSQINQILRSEQTVTELGHRDIEGYLNGFVDLIFSHGDRYYIVDYKTNNLGAADLYHRHELISAMRAHNYGLQYWFYTLVVHRYLQNWVSSYSYDNHFGGVMYLFVRGMVPDKPGSGVFFDRPDASRLIELDHCFGDGDNVWK